MSKYYMETWVATVLSPEGRDFIDNELNRTKPVCGICGYELIRVSMLEGDFIICSNEMYKHPTFLDIIYNTSDDTQPRISRRSN